MKLQLLQILALLALLLSCSGNQVAGTSSDIDIELIGVTVVDSLAVSGAVVVLSDKEDSSTVAATLTDSAGIYRFDRIEVGTYFITANTTTISGDSLQGTISEVSVESGDSTIDLDTLRMQRPGAIHGSVNLNGGTGRVLIYIPGTSYDAHTYGSGEFTMYPVWPDSNYTVRIECDGFTTAQISNITVLPGDTVELSTQNLTANDAPQNVMLNYDTLNNIVTLSWDSIQRDDVLGYVVARKDNPLSSKLPTELNSTIIIDTTYSDTLMDELFSQEDSLTLQYVVLGVTESERTGYSQAVSVNVTITRDSSDTAGFSSFSIEEGTVLTGLTSMELQWKYKGLIEWVKLDLSTDGGSTWQPISGTIKNEGRFYWGQVSNVQSDNCQFRIRDALDKNIFGYSEVFSIEMVGEEMIVNGDFSDALEIGWTDATLYKDSTISASVSVVDEVLKASVTACDTNNIWKIRIGQQPKVPLYKNYTYELRARIRASSPTTLWFDFASYDDGSNRYYGAFTFSVTTEWKECVMRFCLIEWAKDGSGVIDDPVSLGTYLFFNFGNENIDYWLDDVSLTVVAIGDVR